MKRRVVKAAVKKAVVVKKAPRPLSFPRAVCTLIEVVCEGRRLSPALQDRVIAAVPADALVERHGSGVNLPATLRMSLRRLFDLNFHDVTPEFIRRRGSDSLMELD